MILFRFRSAWLLLLGLMVSSAWTYGELNPANLGRPGFSCLPDLTSEAGLETKRLTALLRSPNTLPKDAIREIITYLKNRDEWDGERKFTEWRELTHLYNQRRTNYWINAPSLRTADGDFVCWGETRGHLLIFRADGAIFKSYNPERPNPQGGASYQVDWSDPTLK